ncbi:hypothetical protein ACWTU6_19825 [Mesorhizobium sp. BHbsci]
MSRLRSSIDMQGRKKPLSGAVWVRRLSYSLRANWQDGGRSHMFALDTLPQVPLTDDDRRKLAALVAEQADGELVAAHVGMGNDWLITEDKAGSSKLPASVFDAAHRQWLLEDFGVKITDPKGLAELAEERS